MTPDALNLARLLSKSDTSVSDVLEVCPFRVFVGPGSFSELDTEAWEAHAGGVFAMLELEPRPIASGAMVKIQEDLLANKTVLIVAPTREVLDHARREITAWYSMRRGVVP
jgi:hypothetical protein